MSDDLHVNLQTYKLQFQQVEAALTTDPENEELKKLKEDLHQVLALTKDLIRAQFGENAAEAEGETSVPDTEDVEEKPETGGRHWSVGDRCLAPWGADAQYYEATVSEITETGDVSVLFDNYSSTEVTTLSALRELPESDGKQSGDEGRPGEGGKVKKQVLQKHREYLKKKKLKKQQRFKQLEEERETEKNKWLNFNSKVTGKRGVIKKSIFASPDNVNGRVGIGTCGIGGKPMTEYSAAEKWRKGV